MIHQQALAHERPTFQIRIPLNAQILVGFRDSSQQCKESNDSESNKREKRRAIGSFEAA